jgi:hypothetical protein
MLLLAAMLLLLSKRLGCCKLWHCSSSNRSYGLLMLHVGWYRGQPAAAAIGQHFCRLLSSSSMMMKMCRWMKHPSLKQWQVGALTTDDP